MSLAHLLLLIAGLGWAQDPSPSGGGGVTRLPTHVSLAGNINDFGRFADGGPDENWYIGHNNAWIVQLPAAPIGEFSRAFIGAKLGRAKTRPKPGKPWEREIIPGKIYIGISPTPSFSAERSFFLAETVDIPLEPDAKVYTPGTGASEWFWTEIPAGLVSFSGPNYLIIWSPTSYFVHAGSAPILAALEAPPGAANEGPRAWNNRNIGGVAPRRKEGTLETPILNLRPALAIKLAPPNDATVTLHECQAKPAGNDFVFRFSIEGEGIDRAWLEMSADQLDWERASKVVRRPPYYITIPREKVQPRGAYFRAVARDLLGNEGTCEGIFIANQ